MTGNSLSRVSGNRLVVRHAPDARHLHDQIDRNEEVRCAVPSCGFQRHRLSALCRRHYRKFEATGHHTAPTIRRGNWRSWIVESGSFVSQQLRLDHPGVAAGVAWCAEELFGNRVVARRAEPLRPHTGYSAALARLRRAGVGPDDLLVRWFAASAFRKWDAETEARPSRRAFQDDEHFRHQAAKLFLYPVPFGAPRWAQRDTEDDQGEQRVTKIGPLVRRFTFERVNAALGVLALRAAEEVNTRLLNRVSPIGTLNKTQRINDDVAPFLNSNSESTKSWQTIRTTNHRLAASPPCSRAIVLRPSPPRITSTFPLVSIRAS